MADKTAVVPRDYYEIITQVAKLKDLDVAKLKELMQVQEEWEKRQAAGHYNDQMALAQAAMEPVSKDSVNPVTRSRYASLGNLLGAVQPIYSKFGFSVTFKEKVEAKKDGWMLLLAEVSCGSHTEIYPKMIPVSTTGIGGRTAMTLTHAEIAAVTYGRRALLKMIFNIAEEDDDGNLAGGRVSKPYHEKRAEAPQLGPGISVEDALANLEACEDLETLNDFAASLNGKLEHLFPPDRDKVRRRYTELRDAFQAGSA